MFLGPEGRKQLKELGDVTTIGIEMAVSIVVGLVGGMWLDEKFGTEPVFQGLGFLFGLAAAARSLYRVARKVKAKLEEPSSPHVPPSSEDNSGSARNPSPPPT